METHPAMTSMRVCVTATLTSFPRRASSLLSGIFRPPPSQQRLAYFGSPEPRLPKGDAVLFWGMIGGFEVT